MGELPILSIPAFSNLKAAATTTAFRDVINLCICAAATVDLREAEEKTTELAVFHLGLYSGYFGMVVAALFQFRVPKKLGCIARVKMV